MDKFAAALGLLVCALVALRMAVGPLKRQRFDDACRRLHGRLGARLAGLRRATRRRMRRQAPTARAADPEAARREAEQIIERARRRRQDVDKDGNVIRPRAFDPSRKKPPLQ